MRGRRTPQKGPNGVTAPRGPNLLSATPLKSLAMTLGRTAVVVKRSASCVLVLRSLSDLGFVKWTKGASV